MYRPNKDCWDGPYALLERENETCNFLLPSGPTSFRSTVVKRFLIPDNDNEIYEAVSPKANIQNNKPTNALISNQVIANKPDFIEFLGVLSARVATQSETHEKYKVSWKTEIEGLRNNGVFKKVHVIEAKGKRIHGSRFVDEVKYRDTPDAYEKSRLVVQAFNDTRKGLLTYDRTVQRAS